MEPEDVEDKIKFWLKPILKELRRQNLSFEKVEKDLGLPFEGIKNLHKKEISGLDVYLKLFDYLGLKLSIVNEVGKPLEHRRKFDVSKAANLSKINVQGTYIDMASLYDARSRAVEEMESLGEVWGVWGNVSHRRLQIAADNVMLINIIEDLFLHGRKSRS